MEQFTEIRNKDALEILNNQKYKKEMKPDANCEDIWLTKRDLAKLFTERERIISYRICDDAIFTGIKKSRFLKLNCKFCQTQPDSTEHIFKGMPNNRRHIHYSPKTTQDGPQTGH